MSFANPILHADPSHWCIGTGLDVNALDLTLSSAISEWAQLPPWLPASNTGDVSAFCPPAPMPSGVIHTDPPEPSANIVRQRWFTRLPVEEESRNSQAPLGDREGSFGQTNLAADENYRARLSQRLQPRMSDETLPSSDRLNLFASLFFSRFNSLLPIVHAPSFQPTKENSLLFISICSVGSLFVGSASAVAQGTRLFERLNKAILASWESILSHSCSDALSMVQAAVLGQTFAILSGRPKTLILADVLHGTVMAWTRESNKLADPTPCDLQALNPSSPGLSEEWSRWINHEQRRRVEVALNIHDAELASLLHHEPLRKHRLSQYPRIASDALFAAPSASRWAELYRQTPTPCFSVPLQDDPLQTAMTHSRFSAYGVLESINAHVIEARRSNNLDEHESKRLSSMLMRWWRIYTTHFPQDAEDDVFSLLVLWHSVFIGIYADIDLLEQASGRDGEDAASSSAPLIKSWASTIDASSCLVHALLIQRHLERMRVSSEPAIHIPRALFSAALAWFCFTRIGGRHIIERDAFHAAEIQLIGGFKASDDPRGEGSVDSPFTSVSHLHRLIDLLTRVGRWGISQSFASVLCAALENKLNI
ncbi:hypothetical protein P170DRAFT_366085 [Aspergillus steynii IBT 23096]|uniref:Xylanolytic transcriptional activator regulatory domain-containing protein n=1 Tax=Aspergillus steynii IBT 23096 TaxID=1392250 RepID=A0A2I2FWP5_9EURO|nr:uncharacterized protein P170DRAFT_366085 [Aspergillus steynii IBT 23096]PLB45062.1 hypothetical protein P170DRAFT_366085 [Aspergillus steynii IBT 23096]